MFKKTKSKKGFTLVELLIVLAIIAILAAIAIPMYSAQMNKAREKVDLANLRSAESLAVAEYMLMDSPSASGETFNFQMNGDNLELTTSAATNDNKFKYNQADHGLVAAKKGYIQVKVKEGGEIEESKWVAAPTT